MLVDLAEEIIVVIIYTSIGLFGIKFCWEMLPFDWMKKEFCLEEGEEES